MSLIHLAIECQETNCKRIVEQFYLDVTTGATKYICRRCVNTLYIKSENTSFGIGRATKFLIKRKDK